MKVTQLCLTLCDLTDCSPPGSSLHGIFQARILGWVAISFSKGSSQAISDWTRVSCIADFDGGNLYFFLGRLHSTSWCFMLWKKDARIPTFPGHVLHQEYGCIPGTWEPWEHIIHQSSILPPQLWSKWGEGVHSEPHSPAYGCFGDSHICLWIVALCHLTTGRPEG